MLVNYKFLLYVFILFHCFQISTCFEEDSTEDILYGIIPQISKADISGTLAINKWEKVQQQVC